MEDQNVAIVEHPIHNLAAPLFLITSIPFFGAFAFDYFKRGEFDSTFAWLGLFYFGIGSYYLAKKIFYK